MRNVTAKVIQTVPAVTELTNRVVTVAKARENVYSATEQSIRVPVTNVTVRDILTAARAGALELQTVTGATAAADVPLATVRAKNPINSV